MYITCKCLNVSVKTRSVELNDIDSDKINDLTNNDCCDFFREPLAIANELEGINKEQCGLVMNKYTGLWCIHRCINCSMYTHAVNRNYGAGLVLINKNMIMSNDEIDKLKLNPQYSSIFKIIIDYNKLNNDDDDDDNDKELILPLTKYSMSQLSNNIQLSLTNLQQQLEQAIQKKAEYIDEKIRAFTTEQYQLLEQYRDRGYTEYNLLSRTICDNSSNYSNKDSLNTIIVNNDIDKMRMTNKNYHHNSSSIDTIDNNRSNDNDKNNILGDNDNSIINIATNIDNKYNNKNDNCCVINNERYDCGETMFALEGMDDTINCDDSDAILRADVSDADDSGQDEGIHIPKGLRGGHPTLAKSLPVSVPNFSTFQRQTMQESDDEQLSADPFDPHNIRASIKALAKSVHGDAVFGDLPRPRFSTQI